MATRLAITLVVASLLYTHGLYAQSERGNISGIVSDPQGAAVAGATIKIVNRDTNATVNAVTGSTGEYNAPNLSPGTYRIEITAPGFKRFVQENVIVAAASTLRSDIQLQLGQVSETVEVSASAVVIQTDNAKISTQVQNKLVDELAAGRRRRDAKPVQPGGRRAGSKKGKRSTAVARRRTGGSVGRDARRPLCRHQPLLRHGRSGAQHTVRRSADRVHGRHQRLQSRVRSGRRRRDDIRVQIGNERVPRVRSTTSCATTRWMRAASSREPDRYTARTTSASPPAVPSYIPKLYDGRNKTFFFASFEGFRNRVGANDTILTVPTPEMYRGDFSNWVDQNNRLIPIYDPANTASEPERQRVHSRSVLRTTRFPLSDFSHLKQSSHPVRSRP